MSRLPVPIAERTLRIREAGRLRVGVRNSRGPKSYPSRIDTWRATSPDRDAIEALAATYGGVPRRWDEPSADPGQWEIITDAARLRVVLPPDALSGPIYERWPSKGGWDRRCDGVTCTTWQPGPEGPEQADTVCQCAAEGALSCRIITHLSVILPDVPLTGVWRLTTRSFNAASELPAMVDLVATMQGRGLAYALLALDERREVRHGETHVFAVPVLQFAQSLESLAAGDMSVGSLPQSRPVAELGSGEGVRPEEMSAPPGPTHPDDEIAEAEIVEDAEPEATPSPAASDTDPPAPTMAEIEALVGEARGVGTTRATNKARSLAHSAGLHVPATLTDLDDEAYEQVRRELADWLRERTEQVPGDAGAATVAPRPDGGEESEPTGGLTSSTAGAGVTPAPATEHSPEWTQANRRMRAAAKKAGITDAQRGDLIADATRGRSTSATDATDRELDRVTTACRQIAKGTAHLERVDHPMVDWRVRAGRPE